MYQYNKQKNRKSQAEKRTFSEKSNKKVRFVKNFNNSGSGLAVPVGSDALCRGKDLIPPTSAGAAKPDFVSDNNSSSNKLNPSFKASGGEFEGGQSLPSKQISKRTIDFRNPSLDTKTSHLSSLDNNKQSCIFEKRSKERSRISVFLREVGESYDDAALFELSDKISKCSTKFSIMECADCGRHYAGAVAFYCNSRFCPICARRRSAELSETIFLQVDEALRENSGVGVRLLTLTVENPPLGELAQTIAMMQAGLQKLRRTKYFKERVIGGFKALEITFNEKSRTWHPHFHILLIGWFIEQSWLSETWEKYTGGKIVDIRKVRDLQRGIKEVTKYVTKLANKNGGLSSIFSEAGVFYELYKFLQGRRLVDKFGVLRSKSEVVKSELELVKQQVAEKNSKCPFCGSENIVDTGLFYSITFRDGEVVIPSAVLEKIERDRKFSEYP